MFDDFNLDITDLIVKLPVTELIDFALKAIEVSGVEDSAAKTCGLAHLTAAREQLARIFDVAECETEEDCE